MRRLTIAPEKPFIIIDAAVYQDIQDRLERLEFLESPALKRDIAEAIKESIEGKTTSHVILRQGSLKIELSSEFMTESC